MTVTVALPAALSVTFSVAVMSAPVLPPSDAVTTASANDTSLLGSSSSVMVTVPCTEMGCESKEVAGLPICSHKRGEISTFGLSASSSSSAVNTTVAVRGGGTPLTTPNLTVTPLSEFLDTLCPGNAGLSTALKSSFRVPPLNSNHANANSFSTSVSLSVTVNFAVSSASPSVALLSVTTTAAPMPATAAAVTGVEWTVSSLPPPSV